MVALRSIQHLVGSVGGHSIYPGSRQRLVTALWDGHFPPRHSLRNGSTQGSGARPVLDRAGTGDSWWHDALGGYVDDKLLERP